MHICILQSFTYRSYILQKTNNNSVLFTSQFEDHFAFWSKFIPGEDQQELQKELVFWHNGSVCVCTRMHMHVHACMYMRERDEGLERQAT